MIGTLRRIDELLARNRCGWHVWSRNSKQPVGASPDVEGQAEKARSR
jgi:hypothetical protein